MTNPNTTPNTPGLIRLCRMELEAAQRRQAEAESLESEHAEQPTTQPSHRSESA